jgi:polyisoprenoid-binding protein YceI
MRGTAALWTLLACALISGGVQAQETPQRLWIEGGSTVGGFRCTATEISLDAPGGAGARVSVPVRALDCGHPVRTRHMRQALRAEAHAHIRLDVLGYDAAGEVPAATALLEARLTIAGASQVLRIPVALSRTPDGAVRRVRGKAALRMSEFGIAPPSVLMGAIRVQDALTVHFDLGVL